MLVDIEANGWHYTPPVTDLRWSESHNGGVSASFRVEDPVVLGVLAEDCPVTISDDDGTVLWDGAVAAGGLQMSRAGEAMEVRCVGGVEALSAAEVARLERRPGDGRAPVAALDQPRGPGVERRGAGDEGVEHPRLPLHGATSAQRARSARASGAAPTASSRSRPARWVGTLRRI